LLNEFGAKSAIAILLTVCDARYAKSLEIRDTRKSWLQIK
jgi:hypothetical protein